MMTPATVAPPANEAADARPTDMRKETGQEIGMSIADDLEAPALRDTDHATDMTGATGGTAPPRPSRTATNEAESQEKTTMMTTTTRRQETRVEDAGDGARDREAAGTRKTTKGNRSLDDVGHCRPRTILLLYPRARSPKSPRKNPTLATQATSPQLQTRSRKPTGPR